MTNNNNRSADDVIVVSAKQLNRCINSWGKLERSPKTINLSELAEELKKETHEMYAKSALELRSVYNQALDDFLSKIREVMK